MKPRRTAGPRSFSSPFDPPPKETPEPEVYELNDQVSHDQHGMGTVTAVEDGQAVIVEFRSGDRRRITLPSAKLFRL
jgi:hypothetical protein